MLLEIILGLTGVWILSSEKVPNWIVGKKGYEISGKGAKTIGLILSLPLPVSAIAVFLSGTLFGQEGKEYAYLFETVFFIVDLIVVIFLLRKFRIKHLDTQEKTNV